MKKSAIRKKILNLRKKKNLIYSKINFKYFLNFLKKNKINGRNIGGYYPYNHEVDAINILEKLEKKKYLISLPKIKKNSQMEFFLWSTQDPLLINKYGIPEPSSNEIQYPDILLVPLVAYDNYFNRIGYGGGFYDRYLKKIKKVKKITTIGLAYTFQKVEKVPTNKNDIKLDYIFTENKII